MFVCHLCGGVVPPRTPAARVVVHRRPKRYPLRREANRVVCLDEKGKRKVRITDDPGGVGWEIGREVLACPACAMHRQSCGQTEKESHHASPP
ncbi:MAG TPA: hypothetical protein VFG68_17720 [Fimbriiglobus sp.]|nr:hypothetical protein [Fimbriiglobus sp.]